MPPLILVVDDEPKVARLARDYLEKNGFRVITAADGQSALTITRHERPDLVILDLMLPEIDGREVCRILRANPLIKIPADLLFVGRVMGLLNGLSMTLRSRTNLLFEMARLLDEPRSKRNGDAPKERRLLEA